MLYTADITVPKNTAAASPHTETFKIAYGIITWVSVLFPPGCHGMVYCVILHHEHQIAPSTENMAMRGDTFPVEWNEHHPSDQPGYELKVKLWSPGTTYDHTVTVKVAILPREAIQAVAMVEAVKGLFRILSPGRIFNRGGSK